MAENDVIKTKTSDNIHENEVKDNNSEPIILNTNEANTPEIPIVTNNKSDEVGTNFRSYVQQSFSQKITLPTNLKTDSNTIQANYKDGILKVVLEKEHLAQSIPINIE
eukprot:Pgem_evm1s18532